MLDKRRTPFLNLQRPSSNQKLYQFRSPNSAWFPSKLLPLGTRSCFGSHLKLRHCPSQGMKISNLGAASTPLLCGSYGSFIQTVVPILPKKKKGSLFQPPRASKDVPYPAMTTEPKWWWRTLACLPYLIPLHTTYWMCIEIPNHLHPFLKNFEFLTYPLLEALGRLPRWSFSAYISVALHGIVSRKEWPHFFRFHVLMGIMLEISLLAIGVVSLRTPLAVYWGTKVGMHLWTAIVFACLFMVLEAIRCPLAGMYIDIPFLCDVAHFFLDLP